MHEESSTIKILLKYYNNIQDDKISNSLNNEFNKTASNSNLVNNQNYRYSINSLNSNEQNNKINSLNKNKDFDYKTNLNNASNELTQEYLVHFQVNYPYNNLENKYPPKIINIKSCIYLYLFEKKKLNITLDSLLLFKYNNGKYHLLNDEDIFYPLNNNSTINNNNNIIKDNKCENNISNSTIIYYHINKEKLKIVVELYSKSIDRITLNISKTCSILILKYIILLKLREIEKVQNISNDNISNLIENNNISNDFDNIITLNELEKKLKIYGNGIINNNLKEYISKKETNRNFKNNMILSDIYNYYIKNIESSIVTDNKNNNLVINDNNISISISKDDLNDGIISFIMMEQKEKKCCLGLDFRFTVLQNFIPILETDNNEEKNMKIISIKSYISNESNITKYGLNLYFNCLNNNCKYNNECFILNVGYGNYDIFNLIKYNAYCPFCYISKQDFFIEKKNSNNIKDNNNLNLKYIGMINSKWAYKGYLIGIKMTNVEGKGMTVLKDILYKTKEFDFNHQFKKLIFQIERYSPKNKYNPNEDKNNNINENSFCSDVIYTNKSENNNKIDNSNQILDNNNIINLIDKEKENIIPEIPNELNNNSDKNKKIKEKENKIKVISEIKKKYNDNNENDGKDIFNINYNFENKNNIIKEDDNNNSIITNNVNNNNIKNITKKINAKRNYNLNRKNNSSKGTYFGNAKQVIQNGDGNETNNTNIDFNIIIEKKKSNCCDNCLDYYHPVTQLCCIF